jgi:lipopolysaccharide/colanic/teichoic acid biosynthesis glycosyltransferase
MTSIASSRRIIFLILGDLIGYVFSLILTLTIRYEALPSRGLFYDHISSFAILFVIFLLISFSAGLYDKQSIVLRGRVEGSLVRVQIINFLIGIAFFYFAPVAIAPKANLFIYIIISTAVLIVWRRIMFPVVTISRKQSAVLVGAGEDVGDIFDEINTTGRYGLVFKEQVIPSDVVGDTVKRISAAVQQAGASIIVADLHDRRIEAAIPFLYSLIFSGAQIIDASKMYESIFDRIPLSMVGERWLIENSGTALGTRHVYDGLKRTVDACIAVIGGLVSLVFYPFVYIAIKLDDKGPIFISQDRVGYKGKTVRIIKFRTMSGNDNGKYGAAGVTKNVVTRVGSFLRRSRIDELPQFWNVIKGDLSMVGPRPELPSLVAIYKNEISYYESRHLVKPGLFGWAQIYHESHPHHEIATEETRNKLSYDMYYIKNRSLMLDLKIVLRTLQILIRRSGR